MRAGYWAEQDRQRAKKQVNQKKRMAWVFLLAFGWAEGKCFISYGKKSQKQGAV